MLVGTGPGGSPGRLGGQPSQQLAHGRDRNDMVDTDVLERVTRHRRIERIPGLLDDREATTRLDRQQPGRPVVEGARQDHPNDPGRVLAGGAAEQRVDRGPVAVLARPAGQAHLAGSQQGMMVGWCDVDAPAFDQLPVLDMTRRQRAVPAQDVRERACPGCWNVEDHEHGRREVGGE
jgi:hypothetical protein